MPKVKLLVSTRKGVWIYTADERRERWDTSGPFVGGLEVNHAVMDPRSGVIFTTANDPWFGPQVRYSRDGGGTWADAKASPRFRGDPTQPKDPTATPWFMLPGKVMERLWRIEPGRSSEPGVLYCGVGPAALFRSDDGGETWHENEALSNHSTRQRWNPGAGGLILHSLVLDPNNSDRMWVAISAAGVFRTDDGGKSWQTKNNKIREPAHQFDPNVPLYGEVGQCVHHLLPAAGQTDRLFLQGHWGTYRSDDGGDTWTEITEGLPSSFGLALATHPHDRNTAYVVPLKGGEFRCPPDAKLRVYRTRDAGKSWQPMTKGLPQEDAFMGVYRDNLCTDSLERAGVYMGTNTGQLYASNDDGESWSLITGNLPPITSVQAAVMP
jgi:BNR/Asp-box repeat protein